MGLAVSVVRGMGLPLIHELYGGSESDATLFPTAITRAIERIRQLSRSDAQKLTLVFDKGNNSAKNIESLDHKGVHFIGSLSPAQYPELCSVRLTRFIPVTLENGKDILIFDTKVKAFDRTVRAVVTYNDAAARKQRRRFQKDLGKALADLNLVRWAKVKDAQAKIREVVTPKLPASLFKAEGSGAHLRVSADQSAVRAYKQRFGKTLIFTDRNDLTAVEVVQAYRDRNEVEKLFGEMNDPLTVPFGPVRHWTDQKIIVHAFICILGLLLLKLLQLKLRDQGITLSLELIKDQLEPVSLQLFLTRRGNLFKILSHRSNLQATLFRLFSLENVASMLGAQADSS